MSDQNENLEDLLASGAPQEYRTTGVFEQGAVRVEEPGDFQHLPPAPGEAPPAAATVADHIKMLEGQLAALRNPAPMEITAEQAKALTAWNEKTGWPALTPEELEYAFTRGIKAPQIIRNGKVVCRLMTPQRIRLLNIAAGLAPEPPPVMLAPPVPVQRTGPTGRKIIIVEFDADYDGPLNKAEESFFDTAAEAASMLDVSASALSQAIKKAAGQPFKVKGVTMQFFDLYIADDKNFSKND
jgi:hypothetical protein